jgi:RNA polymerase sigma factor (sigma-70 family)
VSTSSSLQNLLEQRASFLAFVRRRVRDPELAEDILQTAYVRALEKSPGLRDDDSIVAWFYAVLRNAVIDHFRRRVSEATAYTRLTQDLLSERDTTEPDPSARTFVCGCIEHVLAHLRPAYAELLREVDLNEVPLTEFAQRYQLTPGNAAVRAHRARSALRKQLAVTCGACSVHACLDCVCKHQS